MARQLSGTAGLPEDHKPAMARIRLRGWPAIRLLQARDQREEKEPENAGKRSSAKRFSGMFSGLLAIGLETTNEWEGQNQLDLCFPCPSKRW
jgi:hypothetical protein